MKKLELNTREYYDLRSLLIQRSLIHLITPKYFNGIVICVLPIDIALSLGY